MNRLLACRVCLSYDTSLCSIMDGQLRDIYEKLVEASLVTEDMLPTSVCYSCFSLMEKILQFRDRSQKSNQILQQMISMGLEPSLSSLDLLLKAQTGVSESTTSNERDEFEVSVKIESVEPEIDIDETREPLEDHTHSMPVCRDSTSNFEDELPVLNISEQCTDQVKTVKTPKVILTRISVGHEGAAAPAKRKIEQNKAGNEVVNIQAPLRQTVKNEEPREKKEDERQISDLTIVSKKRKSFRTILKETETATSNIISGQQNNGAVTNSEDIFKCDLCKNDYQCRSHLEAHMKKEHVIKLNRKGSITSDLNVAKELQNTNLFKVQEKRNNNKRKENNHCKNKLSGNTSLNECQICMKRLPCNAILMRHLRIHTKEKPFICDICEKGYSRSDHLVAHLRVHSKDKPFKCDVCEKGFSRIDYLTAHLRIHTNEKPFKCNKCEKSFTQKSKLIIHLRVHHTKEKPFKCDTCAKSFSRNDYLTAHLRVHTKEKPYKCDICKKGFSQNAHLTTHLRVHS